MITGGERWNERKSGTRDTGVGFPRDLTLFRVESPRDPREHSCHFLRINPRSLPPPLPTARGALQDLALSRGGSASGFVIIVSRNVELRVRVRLKRNHKFVSRFTIVQILPWNRTLSSLLIGREYRLSFSLMPFMPVREIHSFHMACYAKLPAKKSCEIFVYGKQFAAYIMRYGTHALV